MLAVKWENLSSDAQFEDTVHHRGKTWPQEQLGAVAAENELLAHIWAVQKERKGDSGVQLTVSFLPFISPGPSP